MGTRFLVLVLFILAMVTSSALTVLYLDKRSNVVAGSIDEDTISKLIEKHIQENPDIILAGLTKAQDNARREEERKANENVKQVASQIAESKVVAGNPNGDVTFAIFHDYNCGFCRKAIPDIEKLIKNDEKVKISIKDLPILGEQSVVKGKIATAVSIVSPDRVFDVYVNMSNKNPRNEEQVYALLKDMGIDVAAVKVAASSAQVEEIIAENRSIAQKVGIRGTPAFIVGDQLVKGAVGYAAFKAAVDSARD